MGIPGVDMFFVDELEIENFKPFGERVKIPLAPITLIFGENSAGKSSILQCLYLLKQSLENNPSSILLPRVRNGIVDLGSFKDLMFEHNLSRSLRIKLSFDLSEEDEEEDRCGLEWEFKQETPEEDIRLESLTVFERGEPSCIYSPGPSIDNALSFISNQKKHGWRFSLPQFNRPPEHFKILIPDESSLDRDILYKLYKDKGPIEGLKTKGKDFITSLIDLQKRHVILVGNAFLPVGWGIRTKTIPQKITPEELLLWAIFGESVPDKDAEDLQNIGRWLQGDIAVFYAEMIEDNLRHLYPLKPFREAPQRIYMFSGASVSDLGYSGEKVPEFIFRNKDNIRFINDFFKELDIGYELNVSPLGDRTNGLFEVSLKDARGIDISIADAGFGVSQILPIIVQTVSGDSQVIAVEQPEVHIHPRLQADLGNLFAKGVKEFYNRYIIETHSEHLILRLQKLISEGKLEASDVVVLYVSRGKHGAEVRQVRIDEDGDFIDDWPAEGGFFPERLRELR